MELGCDFFVEGGPCLGGIRGWQWGAMGTLVGLLFGKFEVRDGLEDSTHPCDVLGYH